MEGDAAEDEEIPLGPAAYRNDPAASSGASPASIGAVGPGIRHQPAATAGICAVPVAAVVIVALCIYKFYSEQDDALKARIHGQCADGSWTGRDLRKVQPPVPGAELVQLTVLHRHGIRSAYHELPGDHFNYTCRLPPALVEKTSRWPNAFQVKVTNNVSDSEGEVVPGVKWVPEHESHTGYCEPEPKGSLLEEGYDQLAELGTALRAVYASTLRPGSIYARTTDVPRVRASSAALIDAWHASDAAPKATIWVKRQQNTEPLLGYGMGHWRPEDTDAADSEGYCEKAVARRSKFNSNWTFEAGVKDAYVKSFPGHNMEAWTGNKFADAIYSPSCLQSPPPRAGPGAGPTLWMLREVDRWFTDLFSDRSTRLGFQPLLAELGMRAAAAAAGDPSAASFVVLGGHDSTVGSAAVALLAGLPGGAPALGSNIVLELWDVGRAGACSEDRPLARPASKAAASILEKFPCLALRVLYNGLDVTVDAIRTAKIPQGPVVSIGAQLLPLWALWDMADSMLDGAADFHEACAAPN